MTGVNWLEPQVYKINCCFCMRHFCNNCVWLTLIKIRKNALIWQRWDKERYNITRLICYQVVGNVGKYVITSMTGERLGSRTRRQVTATR